MGKIDLMTDQDFGRRVASVLEKARISQLDFAQRCGVSQPTISGIINGQEPRLGTYRKIERAIEALERELAAQ